MMANSLYTIAIPDGYHGWRVSHAGGTLEQVSHVTRWSFVLWQNNNNNNKKS